MIGCRPINICNIVDPPCKAAASEHAGHSVCSAVKDQCKMTTVLYGAFLQVKCVKNLQLHSKGN